MSEQINQNASTPDDLLNDFKGKPFKSIVIFTIAVHAVVILVTSIPFLLKPVLGGDNSNLSEQERMDKATREATESLRAIAKEHGVKPQDLSEKFDGKSKAAAPSVEPSVNSAPATPAPEPAEKPKSAIEKELETTSKGPALPSVPKDTEEDLFK